MLTVLTSLFMTFAWAQAKSCPTLQEEQLSFTTVQSLIKNPDCNIRSISDVLSHLPESYRSQYVNFYKSRSLQGPHQTDYKNPRTLLMGEKSKLIISFNGDPKQPGYLGLEMAEINTEGGKEDLDVLKFYEIGFPSDDEKAKKKTWKEVQTHISYSDANPNRCTACHGSPARPIYPSYPVWEGSFGSKHIGVQDPKEVKGFEDYSQMLESQKASRYQHLKPQDLLALERSNDMLDTKLSFANGVRVSRLIMKTPDYNKYKYAFLGAFLGCKNFEDFLPDQPRTALLRNMTQKFQLAEKWPESKQTDLIRQIYNTKDLFVLSDLGLSGSNSSRESTPFSQYSKKFLQDLQGSEDFKRLKLDTISIQGPMRGNPETASLRLITEGRGLDISTWFIDLTQPTYRDGGGTANMAVSRLILEDSTMDNSLKKYINNGFIIFDRKNELCEKLKPLSRKSLANIKVAELQPSKKESTEASSLSPGDCNCDISKSSLKTQAQDVKVATELSLNHGYPVTFINTCSVCHDSATKIAPKIPFSSQTEMSKWLSNSKNKALIQEKLTTSDETNRMPPTRNLSPEELSQILGFIDSTGKK